MYIYICMCVRVCVIYKENVFRYHLKQATAHWFPHSYMV